MCRWAQFSLEPSTFTTEMHTVGPLAREGRSQRRWMILWGGWLETKSSVCSRKVGWSCALSTHLHGPFGGPSGEGEEAPPSQLILRLHSLSLSVEIFSTDKPLNAVGRTVVLCGSEQSSQLPCTSLYLPTSALREWLRAGDFRVGGSYNWADTYIWLQA